jgi:hypothetical protein
LIPKTSFRDSGSDIPVLKIPGMCVGGLTCSPGDITYKYCLQNKQGTRHNSIKAPQNFKTDLPIIISRIP